MQVFPCLSLVSEIYLWFFFFVSFTFGFWRESHWFYTSKFERSLTKNCGPVSALSFLSKIFEKIIENQLLKYIEKVSLLFVCRSRKGFFFQSHLISHELLIAELQAHGIDKNVSNRRQLAKIDTAFSSWISTGTYYFQHFFKRFIFPS